MIVFMFVDNNPTLFAFLYNVSMTGGEMERRPCIKPDITTLNEGRALREYPNLRSYQLVFSGSGLDAFSIERLGV